jgi:branched-subunit amino acid transport protein
MRIEILGVILGMALVTFVPRFLPMAVLSRWVIPERIRIGLSHLPVSILSAIVFPILFFNGEGNFGIQPRLLLAALPVFAFSWWVRSLWGSVVLGMLVYWGLGFIL